jgi:transcription antitermination factor NusG
MSALQNSTSGLLLSNLGIELDQPSWFAIQTRPRYEKKVTAELEEKGVKAFLPLHFATHQWSDRRRVVQLPIFTGYVFVWMAPLSNARISVLRTNGVISFVGVRNVGSPIPNCEIEAIQAVLDGGAAFKPYPYLKVGQRVRVRGGYLDGVIGVLTAVNGHRGLVISVDLIQRSIVMKIEGFRVESL